MKILRNVLIVIGAVVLAALIINALFFTSRPKHQSFDFSEGTVSTAVITAGPFDLHRRYRSMEGPYISFNFRPGDVVASKEIKLPEGLVTFVEGNNTAPAMMGGAASPVMTSNVQGLVDTSTQPRTLLWLKGIKEEVLDEHDQPLPSAEFICHWNLDVRPDFRNAAFPGAASCTTTRLATITQGQTELTFPDGYGVPVASNEPWNCVFQAANRTTDDHRRIKHRCTLYFIKDSDLMYPITALNWYAPYVYVVIDKNSPQTVVAEKTSCPSCLGLSLGVNAPNNTSNGIFTDRKGRLLSGHWVIPPGTHSYTSTINDELEPGFNEKQRTLHAVWTHVHPLCTDLRLYKCERKSREEVFGTTAKTDTAHGLQIDYINYWSSKKGIVLPEKVNYELEVTYENTTKTPQDSMAVAGMFFEDPTFYRPDWVLHAKDGYACSMTKACTTNISSSNAASTTNPTNITIIVDGSNAANNISSAAVSTESAVPASVLALPIFDKNQDGPLLRKAKTVKLQTNAGPLTCYIDPAIAPITATQLYKLLSSDTFVGTRICRFDPDYLLQIANAEDKAPGQSPLSGKSRRLLRRVPLEVSSQMANKVKHQKYVLSMARYQANADSGSSSFSILLKDSPHLDRQYTIFGRLEEDPETLKTLDKIEKNWDPNKYWIVGRKTASNTLSSN